MSTTGAAPSTLASHLPRLPLPPQASLSRPLHPGHGIISDVLPCSAQRLSRCQHPLLPAPLPRPAWRTGAPGVGNGRTSVAGPRPWRRGAHRLGPLEKEMETQGQPCSTTHCSMRSARALAAASSSFFLRASAAACFSLSAAEVLGPSARGLSPREMRSLHNDVRPTHRCH